MYDPTVIVQNRTIPDDYLEAFLQGPRLLPKQALKIATVVANSRMQGQILGKNTEAETRGWIDSILSMLRSYGKLRVLPMYQVVVVMEPRCRISVVYLGEADSGDV